MLVNERDAAVIRARDKISRGVREHRSARIELQADVLLHMQILNVEMC